METRLPGDGDGKIPARYSYHGDLVWTFGIWHSRCWWFYVQIRAFPFNLVGKPTQEVGRRGHQRIPTPAGGNNLVITDVLGSNSAIHPHATRLPNAALLLQLKLPFFPPPTSFC